MSSLNELMTNLNSRIAEQIKNYKPSGEVVEGGTITQEVDPTVPSWAKASKKPTYSASEVGAYSKSEVDNKLKNKQNSLAFDNEPTENSEKMVKSGGIFSAIKAVIPSVFSVGKAGLVPSPTADDAEKYLKGDGSWGEVLSHSKRSYYFTIITNSTTVLKSCVEMNSTVFLDGDVLFIRFQNGNATSSPPKLQTKADSNGVYVTLDGVPYKMPCEKETICVFSYSLVQNSSGAFESQFRLVGQLRYDNWYSEITSLRTSLGYMNTYSNLLDCVFPKIEAMDIKASQNWKKGDCFIVENQNGDFYMRSADMDLGKNESWIEGQSTSETTVCNELNKLHHRISALEGLLGGAS